jgi:hypothetical protein
MITQKYMHFYVAVKNEFLKMDGIGEHHSE